MTATSKESTERSPDTINVLPTLSEASAPVSLTLTIDKSVSKLAGWVLVLLFAMTLLTGISATVTVMTVRHSGDREDKVNDQLTVSQNHWRNLEVDVRALEKEVARYAEQRR